MADKPHMNLAVIGHIDHGKSTLVGRLMFDTGAVPAHMIEKYKQEAKEKGKESFAFAWVMDSLKEERERGITIDIAHRRFDTDKFYFTVVDCPGHRDFVKNMITGASQADAAILVVAAPDGVMAQTREHIFLSRTLGLLPLILRGLCLGSSRTTGNPGLWGDELRPEQRWCRTVAVHGLPAGHPVRHGAEPELLRRTVSIDREDHLACRQRSGCRIVQPRSLRERGRRLH